MSGGKPCEEDCVCGLHVKSKEHREKISATLKGHPSTMASRIGTSITEEHKQKISDSLKGRVFSEEHKQNLSLALTGKLLSDEAKEKLRKYAKENNVVPPHYRGEQHPNWQGRPTIDSIRKSAEYLDWKYAVIKRDNYTCVWCGLKSRKIHVDHIKSFASYPELRFDVDNGRVLCIPCHKKTDTWGRSGNARRLA